MPRFFDSGVHPRRVFLVVAMLLVLSPASRVLGGEVFFPHLTVPTVDMVGVGAGFYPQFWGAKEYSFGAAPLVRIHFSGHRYVQVLINELRVNLLDDEHWELGPLGLYRFGRYDTDNNIVNRMDTIQDTVELGGFVNYSLFDSENPIKRISFGAYAEADVGGVNDGWLAGASVTGFYPLVEFLTLTSGVITTWSSENFNDAYFGVSGSEALATGLEAYSPGSGIRDLRAYMGLILHLSLNWHIGGGALYGRLLEPGSESPIVEECGDANQWVYGMGVIYSW